MKISSEKASTRDCSIKEQAMSFSEIQQQSFLGRNSLKEDGKHVCILRS